MTGALLCAVCMFPMCLRRFSPDTPVFSPQYKNTHVWLTGDSKLSAFWFFVLACLCDGLATCPGCIPAFSLKTAGTDSKKSSVNLNRKKQTWIIDRNNDTVTCAVVIWGYIYVAPWPYKDQMILCHILKLKGGDLAMLFLFFLSLKVLCCCVVTFRRLW